MDDVATGIIFWVFNLFFRSCLGDIFKVNWKEFFRDVGILYESCWVPDIILCYLAYILGEFSLRESEYDKINKTHTQINRQMTDISLIYT